jgi:N-acetylneuraminate synthase/N,N'-diacetyllegionaminate synthase
MNPGSRALAVGSRSIGPGAPVWVIAEAGVNHDGDPAQAQRLAAEAKRAGADCVKFQTFSAERVAAASAPKARYQLQGTSAHETQLEMLRKLELGRDAHEGLLHFCKREGIEFLSTPYSVEDVDFLESLGVPAYKVASALLVEPDLLARLAATRKPILLSTGLATMEEVTEAVDAIRVAGNNDIVVLQCTTNYPAAIADANLRAMHTMGSELGVLVGYSDHTIGTTTAVAAVALGAVVVEKHFTLDKTLPGPDHAASADPPEFRSLVRAIREVESALGDGRKAPSESELANKDEMRRGLVASARIAAGSVVTAEMVTAKRPATGIPARDAASVVGRRASVDIEEDQSLEWWMLA